MNGDWFVGAVILLQTCATLAYCWQRKYREALVWFGVVLSNVAYLSLSRS